MQDPAEVARGLEEIAALLTFAGEPKFKIKAYEHAARIVDSLGAELGPLVEQDRLRSLHGIGSVLSQQIHELWNTGSSELLLRLRSEHPAGAARLIRVAGMTPRRIRALDAALGVHDVEGLRAACVAGRVRQVPGFGEKLEHRLLEACDRWLGRGAVEGRRLTLAHAEDLATFSKRELEHAGLDVHVAGAVRRGEETIGELSLVARGDLDAGFERLGVLRQTVRVDRAQSRVQLSDGIPLALAPAGAGLGNALLIATGSEAHVAAVRERANVRGFDLAGLAGAGARGLAARSFESEQELYAAVGLPLVPPELRAGTDELERAERGELDGLLEASDIRGMVHCHTTYSDGKHGILEMARAAHALGMQFITITDHSPSAHYANGVTLDRLKQQWDEIASVAEQVPIRILRGTESDILSEGGLDLPDAVLEQLDVVIASIHARHRQDREAMTRRLVRALSLPIFKIWGHGLGRILNHRAPIDCDVPRVLDALAASRGAVEINADPHRLDLPAAWVPAARERGIPFVISVDAHSTKGFGVLRYGVTQARRGGVLAREVLNARGAEEFAALVKPVA